MRCEELLCSFLHPFLFTFFASCRSLSILHFALSFHRIDFDMHFSIPLTLLLADVLGLVPGVLAHNYVQCTNVKSNLTALLTIADGNYDSGLLDHCDGYPRGVADSNTDIASLIGDQGFPW
jgi:hypothetical protein